MVLQILTVFLVLVAAMQTDIDSRVGSYLLVKTSSLHPSSPAKPYRLVSFNYERDSKVGHLRPLNEMLKKDLDLVFVDPSFKWWNDSWIWVFEVGRDEVPEALVDQDVTHQFRSRSHPVVRYFREPSRGNITTRVLYQLANEANESVKGATRIFVKNTSAGTKYALGYEVIGSNEPFEMSQCESDAQLGLFQKVYQASMTSPGMKDKDGGCIFSFFRVPVCEEQPKAVLTMYLEKSDNDPEIYWTIVKEIMNHQEYRDYVAQITLRVSRSHKTYSLGLVLDIMPNSEQLKNFRLILRNHVGACTTFNAQNHVDDRKICHFLAARLKHSVMSFTATSRNSRRHFPVNGEIEFTRALDKHSDFLTFKLERTIGPCFSGSEIEERVKVPLMGKRKLFERMAIETIFSKTFLWGDHLRSIELKSEPKRLVVVFVFQMLAKEDNLPVQNFLLGLVARQVEELSGRAIVSGFSGTRELPEKSSACKPARTEQTNCLSNEPETLEQLALSTSSQVETPKNDVLDMKEEVAALNLPVSETNMNDAPCSIERTVSLPNSNQQSVRARRLVNSKFCCWLNSLADEEFDSEVEAFRYRLTANVIKSGIFSRQSWKPLIAYNMEVDRELSDLTFVTAIANFQKIIWKAIRKWNHGFYDELASLTFRNLCVEKPNDSDLKTVTAMSCSFDLTPKYKDITCKIIVALIEDLYHIVSFNAIHELVFELSANDNNTVEITMRITYLSDYTESVNEFM